MEAAMSDALLFDRFEGCLLGGAIGDALGYPVEFLQYEDILERFGTAGITSYDLSYGPVAHFSDDTQMTLFSADGLVAAGAQASEAQFVTAVYNAYLDWLRTQEEWFTDNPGTSWLLGVPELHARRAPGNTCLSALESGTMGSMEERLNNSKGCGGVMRVAPMGLFFDNGNKAAHVAALAAALTHSHPLGYIPAAGLAHLVHACARRGCEVAAAVDECIAQLPAWFENDPYHVQQMVSLLRLAVELAGNDEADATNIPQLGEGWVGEEALAISVYACLRYQDSFSDAVIAAVNHSGDSDSTGAIAGNIMGARVGASGIDAVWMDSLEVPEVLRRAARELFEARQQ